ncbi:MAG: nucleotidyl transferase AbiEii/AbiGii toxin family protein [bacterium]|nr:nucleotidyl transferase AbiEii/AbiGii toxin family protein [bacterium]
MTKLLLGLVRNKQLASKLAFKGGTALYLFGGLDRFSTDLDFDLVGKGGEAEIALIDEVIKDNLTIMDKKTKRYTWYWCGSYEKGMNKIKVEVNTRQYPNEYERKDYRGYSLLIMKPEYMMAHKLCAVLDRKKLQNRDLYDIWWMLKHDYWAEKTIVELRMGVNMKDYWGKLLKLVRKLPANYDILSGLGEVMGEGKKDWVKAKLIAELELELASRV